jgi:transposase
MSRPPKITLLRAQEILDANPGRTTDQIAAIAGVSHGTVMRWRSLLGRVQPRRSAADHVAVMRAHPEDTPDEIAARIGVTAQYVRRLAYEFSIRLRDGRRKAGHDEMESRIREHRGETAAAVAAALGICTATVWRYRRQMGDHGAQRGRKVNAEEIRGLLREVEGLSARTAAARLGRSRETIYHWRRRYFPEGKTGRRSIADLLVRHEERYPGMGQMLSLGSPDTEVARRYRVSREWVRQMRVKAGLPPSEGDRGWRGGAAWALDHAERIMREHGGTEAMIEAVRALR